MLIRPAQKSDLQTGRRRLHLKALAANLLRIEQPPQQVSSGPSLPCCKGQGCQADQVSTMPWPGRRSSVAKLEVSFARRPYSTSAQPHPSVRLHRVLGTRVADSHSHHDPTVVSMVIIFARSPPLYTPSSASPLYTPSSIPPRQREVSGIPALLPKRFATACTALPPAAPSTNNALSASSLP